MIKNFNEYSFLNEGLKLSKIVKRVNYMDYDILIGRSAKMNDILTFEVSTLDDIWLHVSGVPGSHIIIKVKDKEIPPYEVIQKGAELAKLNSKSDGESKVVWTQRKNVTKLPDHSDGQVLVNYKKSKFITI